MLSAVCVMSVVRVTSAFGIMSDINMIYHVRAKSVISVLCVVKWDVGCLRKSEVSGIAVLGDISVTQAEVF